MTRSLPESYFDPYDLWATSLGVAVRRRFYRGEMLGKAAAVSMALADWLLPGSMRRLAGASRSMHPITAAHYVLISSQRNSLPARQYLPLLAEVAAWQGRGDGSWAWGLGFPWMSKNGLYPPDTPFVTHTPYVMEALLDLAREPAAREEAMEMFHGTWSFLEALLPVHRSEGELALSYAPVVEPRIVVNANAYACFAYALQARFGRVEVRERAAAKAKLLACWVANRQDPDGGWRYYADRLPGNFIDCFHSCFVVKNLKKAAELLPELEGVAGGAVVSGWRFIRDRFYDPRAGLCRRFLFRDIRDPFRWDLYDQAEYLGLLVDFGALEEACRFREEVARRFCRNGLWCSRIDIFGRLLGKNFIRWGIAPFWLSSARLDNALTRKGPAI